MSALPPTAERAALRPRRLLGDVLVDLGLCSRDVVESAVAAAREASRPMGAILIERGLLSTDELTLALAERFELTYLNLRDTSVDMAAAGLVPAAAARRMDAVPVAFRDAETLLVAMVNPANILALDDLAMLTDLRVEPAVVSREDLDDLLERLGRVDDHLLEPVEQEPDVEDDDDALHARADDAPTVKLVRSIIAQAVEQGASDVHFDAGEDEMLVRYRIDGVMADATRVPRRQAPKVLSRLKILAELDIAERRLPQDGRVGLSLHGRRVDLRITTVPLVTGESAVLRILDPGRDPLSLEHLGMAPGDRARLESALHRAHGGILATGPTGSGKSTSLYAAVDLVRSAEKTLMTIEDPVEYRLEGVKQMQVAERVGLTFATGLRSIMRADPDIIMVGEMRDRESAQITMEAALTGHLVLSTLHTNDAASAPARLIDMGIEPYVVASAVDCVVAQRLARRLCPGCREPARAVLDGGDKVDVFEPQGCPRCRHTGYRGRIGLYEVMTMSDEIRALVVARAPAGEIARTAVAQGMRRLRDDGLEKVRAGDTSLAEVARVVG
jgi:type IV pilus assembly protein PilB